jgi:thiol-disulfide isomerase/thioredoxin
LARKFSTFAIFVFFYSGHCKKLAPEYEEAAAFLAAQDPPLTLAKMDATASTVVAKRDEIKSFPTIEFFK